MAMSSQFDLFGAPRGAAESGPALPGFRYWPDVITGGVERTLIDRIAELPLREFEFHGYTGKRRVVSFGWKYDFGTEALREANDIPEFLLEVRRTAAGFAGLAPEQLQQVLVTEYSPGAGIGWHRDKNVFNEIVGISLLAPCVFRLRRRVGEQWDRANIIVAPRSAYLLSGPSRTEWEHSIPPVGALRYSITFRHLREPDASGLQP
jgi:alkylated DNA repair dioxygenase AlkB